MPRMTSAELAAYESRHRPKTTAVSTGVEKESVLHEQIFAECRRRGWIALHGAMSERSHRTLGEPDFVIMADDGLTFYVECKSRTGKLTEEQCALMRHAIKLGHPVYVVRSFEEFLDIIACSPCTRGVE